MQNAQLLDVLNYLPHPRTLVVGDLMLDRYTWGGAERISQEAPVIVMRADRREARLGGAANVAHMSRGLEAAATCVGVVGNDASGNELRGLAAAAGVDISHILTDAKRPTTVKERFMGLAGARHPSQILRVDTESREPLDAALERTLIDRCTALVAEHDIVLLSDYGKGVCTARLTQALIAAARAARVPVVVDPVHGGDYGRYRGCTLIKPNRVETELATGIRIVQPRDAIVVGHRLCHELKAEYALITLDRDGMALAPFHGRGELFPTLARNVYDITGAGDMVMAMVGACLAAGVTPEATAHLANIAAGLEVERTGVAIITRQEIRQVLEARLQSPPSKVLPLADATVAVNACHKRGQKVVFTNGCFDLLHVGHVQYLAEAAQLGDVLVVGINSDRSVSRIKGPSRPVIAETDRAAMLAALACVDYVVVFDEETPHNLLHALQPDVLVKGGTYSPSQVVGHEVVEAYGGRVCVTGLVPGVSTSHILETVRHSPDRPLRRAG